jgi:L-ascorbate metabolism protein UlaG (beta-lactamase superfamily)
MPGALIEYVGHATTIVGMDGTRLITDPLLRNRVAHLRRTSPVDARALGDLDAVLISHLHYDHLDLPSLRRLGVDVPVVCPRGAGLMLKRRQPRRRVVEVSVGDEIVLGSLRVLAVDADHAAGRLPWGAKVQPLGYVVGGSRSVYFAGDTDVFDGMRTIGPVDVALLPIWGWGPALGPGHMDPTRAAASLRLLEPAVAIPIHWGTYYPLHAGLRGAPSFVSEPAAAFVREAAAAAPGVEIRVLAPGEATTV